MAEGNSPPRPQIPFDFFNDGIARPVTFGKSFLEESDDEDEYLSVTCEFCSPVVKIN